VELGFQSMGDPLIPPGNKNLKIAQMEVELETFAEEEDTIELGEV
jgi:hypothetical protein